MESITRMAFLVTLNDFRARAALVTDADGAFSQPGIFDKEHTGVHGGAVVAMDSLPRNDESILSHARHATVGNRAPSMLDHEEIVLQLEFPRAHCNRVERGDPLPVIRQCSEPQAAACTPEPTVETSCPPNCGIGRRYACPLVSCSSRFAAGPNIRDGVTGI